MNPYETRLKKQLEVVFRAKHNLDAAGSELSNVMMCAGIHEREVEKYRILLEKADEWDASNREDPDDTDLIPLEEDLA